MRVWFTGGAGDVGRARVMASPRVLMPGPVNHPHVEQRELVQRHQDRRAEMDRLADVYRLLAP